MPDNEEVYVLCHWTDADGIEILDVYATVELAMARELPEPVEWKPWVHDGIWAAGEDHWYHGWTIQRQRLITP